MAAVIDHQSRKPQLAGARHQHWQAKVKRCVGKTALRIHLDDGGCRVGMQNRNGDRVHLARLDGSQHALDPVNAMRFAGVTLGGHNNPCQSVGLNGADTGLAKDLKDQAVQGVDGEEGYVVQSQISF